MKALILNSGLGSRMKWHTKEHPKCMTDLINGESILSRQLSLLQAYGVKDVVITTGYYDQVLMDYCKELNMDLNITFVKNSLYDCTNYIYSIYCARDIVKDEDIVLLHGDLVFDESVLEMALNSPKSCMTVSTTAPLPEKDFKAVLVGDKIVKVGIEFFDDAVTAQPLYKLNKTDWNVWLDKIVEFCENDVRKCYAENAFNQVSDRCEVFTVDVLDKLCAEIDTPEDLTKIVELLKQID